MCNSSARLNSHIDIIEKKSAELQEKFYEEFNVIVKEGLNINDDFDIRDYVVEYGGYKLGIGEFDNLPLELKKYYRDKAIKIKNDKVYLRGYDYYSIDPLMNRDDVQIDQQMNKFRNKWDRYRLIDSFDFIIHDGLSIEVWTGLLGLMEALFSDLTSLEWFLFRNEKNIICELNSEYYSAKTELVSAIDNVGEIISELLKFNMIRVYDLLVKRYSLIVRSELLNKLFKYKYSKIEKASLRAIREGDSIAFIVSSYLQKLKPFCKKEKLEKITILSNAFGAMNTGVILKHLLSPEIDVVHHNILFAQHRDDEDSVYKEELVNKCVFLDEMKEFEDGIERTVIIADDSVYTGLSYSNIKQSLLEEYCCKVYLLPYTVCCTGMRFLSNGMKEGDNLEQILEDAIYHAEEINGIVPCFYAPWSFQWKSPSDENKINEKTYHFAMDGSDLLLRHLWNLYMDDIL